MSRRDIEISELSNQLADRVLEIAERLLPGGKKKNGYWVVGSLAGESGNSLAVRLNGARAGKWRDYAGAETDRGDLVDLWFRVGGFASFGEAVIDIKRYLGLDDGSSEPPSAEAVARAEAERQRKLDAQRKAMAAEDTRARKNLNGVWRASVPLTHPAAEPARKYLASRGIQPDKWPGDLRFHPSLTYWGDEKALGRYPALIARISTVGGKPGTLHRTYLTPEGAKLVLQGVDADPRKMMAHPSDTSIIGGAIRLGPVTRILGVAEGIETALSAHMLDGITVWSCVTAGLMESFLPPPGVEKVVIYADLDRSGRGQEAARKLTERLWGMGIMAGIRFPEGEIPEGKKGIDWNDILLAA